jgi:hypothetical protein
MTDNIRKYDANVEIYYYLDLVFIFLLELIFRDITVLNSIEISQGGSNTDSDSKRGVQCKDSSILYLAFIIRNLF